MAKRRSAGTPALSPHANWLLAALPVDDYRRLLPLLEPIRLKLKRVLYKPGDVIDYVYFPGGGFCSVVTVLGNGEMVEVTTIGREGLVGVSAIGADNRETSLTMVQMETDECSRLPAAAFRGEMERRGAFADLITQFVHALFGVVMQATACNAIHTVEQRLARWLLMAQDRVGQNQFPLTQELVAMMLGAARPTVTIVAGALQRAGLITYHRGQVVIVNRAALEKASCECYGVTADLLGRAPRGRRLSRA